MTADDEVDFNYQIWSKLRHAFKNGTHKTLLNELNLSPEEERFYSELFPHKTKNLQSNMRENKAKGIYQHYLSYIATDFGDPDEPDKGPKVAKLIDEQICSTQRRMSLRSPSETRVGYGLVIGRIQSGKTAHLMGVVSKALDPVETPSKFDTVIILSGLIDDLRTQTLSRFNDTFEDFDGNKPLILPPAERDLTDENREVLDEISNHFVSNDSGKQLILIIKKNHIVLQHLLDCIPKSQPLRNRRVLIIDDEADHASIDTGQEENQDIDSGEEIDEDPNATNRLLRQIIKLFNDSLQSWYIGYTATPFANLLSHPESSGIDDEFGLSLHPRDMIQVLEKPYSHLDNENYFLTPDSRNVLIRNPFIENSPEETRLLRETVLRHILTEQIKIHSRNIRKHHTTLIHTSIRVEEHRRITDCVLNHIEEFRDDDKIIDEFRKLSKEYDLKSNELQKLDEFFNQLEDDWNLFLDILDRIETVEVNARKREDGDFHLQHLKYSKFKSNSYIAIGGTRLSRGLTLEGLTTSLFTRSARVPLYDTMLQMSRWCGYRPRYGDLVRITTNDDIRSNFVNIANEEADLRRKISILPEDCDPTDEIIWIREHPGMQVTRKEAMRNVSRRGWGGLQRTSFWGYGSPALSKNIEPKTIESLYQEAVRLIEYTKDLGIQKPIAKGTGAFDLSTGVPWQFIEQFLNSYLDSFTEEQTTKTQSLLNQFLSYGGIDGDWNVGIHIPDKTRTVKIRDLNIGLVNRSRDSKGDFRVVQSDGSNSTIDLHEEQIQRTTPLLLVYMVDQNSTQGDKGIDKTFSEKVLHPVPTFGICLPNDSYGDGGTEISRPH